MNPNGDGEVDENFWAQAAADQAVGRAGEQEGDDSKPNIPNFESQLMPAPLLLAMNDGPIPFNTQFFHDDYDDGPGFDDVDPYDGDGGVANADASEQDLLASTQGQTRRVRPEFVKYAKRAKRVDVRKLKENIWRGLDIVVTTKPKEDEDNEAMVETYFFGHVRY